MSIITLLFPSIAFSLSSHPKELSINVLQNQKTLDITPTVLILDNTDKQFSRETILSGEANQYFKPTSTKFVHADRPDRDMWLSFKVAAQVKHDSLWFLSISQSYFEYLHVYQLNSEGDLIKTFEAYKNQKSDGLFYPDQSFEFSLHEGDVGYFYINIRSLNKIVSKVLIQPPSEFAKDAIIRSLLDGGFFGALLIIFIYNLFIYLSSRDLIHIYYAGYVFMAGVCFFGIDSLGKQYLGEGHFLNTDFPLATSSLLMFVFYLLFLEEHLSLYQRFPWLKKLYRSYFLFIAISIAVCAFMENYLIFLLTYVALGIYCFLSFTPLFRLSLEGNKSALVVLLAYFLPISFASLFIISDLGIIYMEQDDIGFLVKYASVLEFVILAFALANRFFRDRTESYNFQKQSILNLQESDRLKREFLATLSHEFRTPMNGVQGSLELIALSNPSLEITKHLENAKKSSKHMLSLIEDVLQFVEVDEKPELDNIEFDLEDLLAGFQEKYKERLAQKSVSFNVNNIAVGRKFIGDYKRINLALKHLLDNAAKFTETGFVELLVSDRYFGSRCELHFRIIDTGIGVPINLQDHIFSFFRQGDGSYSRRFGGLGLGLTIAKKQIDTLKGRLTFESVPEKGSTFIVAIPVNVQVKSAVTSMYHKQLNYAGKSRLSEQGNKLNPVLIVEDNALNQTVIKAMVESLGYEAVLCSDGLQAVNWAQKNTASIILMDCQMPVMDGFEATKKIRASENNNSELAIIAVTGNVSEPEIQRCYEAGMDEVLTKPIQKVEIDNLLKRWVES